MNVQGQRSTASIEGPRGTKRRKLSWQDVFTTTCRKQRPKPKWKDYLKNMQIVELKEDDGNDQVLWRGRIRT